MAPDTDPLQPLVGLAPLSSVRAGEPITADNENAVRDRANQLTKAMVRLGMDWSYSKDLRPFWGVIDHTGHADYADCRYWVRNAYLNDTASAKTDIPNFAFVGSVHANQVTATNLGEYKSNTHNLARYTPVLVFPLTDIQQPAIVHWVFMAGSGDISTSMGFDVWVNFEVSGSVIVEQTRNWLEYALPVWVTLFSGTTAEAMGAMSQWSGDAWFTGKWMQGGKGGTGLTSDMTLWGMTAGELTTDVGVTASVTLMDSTGAVDPAGCIRVGASGIVNDNLQVRVRVGSPPLIRKIGPDFNVV